MTDLTWLRKLLNDTNTSEVEVTDGNGTTTTFLVRNPPVPDDDTTKVTVAGEQLARGSEFYVTDSGRSITIPAAPADGAQIVITYSSQLWDDDELQTYLQEATKHRDPLLERPNYIKTAGIMAIDTLLSGTATGLDFGAGAETFNISSVFQRLMALRDAWRAQLTQDDDETPAFGTADIEMDLGDPDPTWVGDPTWDQPIPWPGGISY